VPSAVCWEVVAPFWISIAVLSLAQGAVVALPSAWPRERWARLPLLARLRTPRWALVPPASIVVFVFGAGAAEHASAQALTYLALCAVPPLAALALAALAQRPRPARALLVPPLFALAWLDRGGLAGEAAAVTLTALSCVALGDLLGAVTPARWLALGILAMAAADTALVVADLLQRPNNVLNAAHPAAGLPRLQSAAFGSAVMGYGDLFVAALLGGLLANACARRLQLRAAALAVALALGFDLLFFAVSELPATVPIALTLLVLSAARRRQGAAWPQPRRREAAARSRPHAPLEGAPARPPRGSGDARREQRPAVP
jgi:hypothetical protein